MNYRIVVVTVIFFLCFAVIGGKAAYLQVYRGSWLSQLAADQYQKSFTTKGKRGTIYDSRMTELAVSLQVTSIAAYPPRIENPRATAQKLANVLKLNRKAVLRDLTASRSFVWIKRQASPKEVQQIKSMQIKGIGFIPEYNRFYPNKHLAAQVIGFTGIDGNGLEGLEYSYEHHLRGTSGQLHILQDALGHGFYSAKSRRPNDSGHGIVLTIDRTIQFIAEKALSEATHRYAAQAGVALVMVPDTGAVLAIAQYPFFNPNAFRRYRRDQWRNRAITDPFEPGSTMKVFSAIAAIESGGSSPSSIFFCENGNYRIGNSRIHDLKAHGWLSLRQIIKFSSNIGAVKISEMVGADQIYRTLRDFGFGQRTGIDCPGETGGSLTHFDKWTPRDAGAVSFGYGISVSPLQLVTAVSAIANGGVLMKPYLVKAILQPNGGVVHRFEPQVIRRVVSEQTARLMGGIMQSVITAGGTGHRAALDGYTAAGKTGTAQKLDAEGNYSESKYVASFIGYAPAQKPAIAVLVVIDEPQGEYYGGIVAAPVFRQIANATLGYLNVPLGKPVDQVTTLTIQEVHG